MKTLNDMLEAENIHVVMDSLLNWKFGPNTYILQDKTLTLSRWPRPEEEQGVIEKIMFGLQGTYVFQNYQEPYVVVDTAWKGTWEC